MTIISIFPKTSPPKSMILTSGRLKDHGDNPDTPSGDGSTGTLVGQTNVKKRVTGRSTEIHSLPPCSSLSEWTRGWSTFSCLSPV